jgi:SAM-dependent methyltransferase
VSEERSRFAGGDQTYLREEQYRDASRLEVRANLHARCSTAAIGWYDWVVARLDLPAGARVLEAGCGAGWLWEQAAASWSSDVAITLTDLSSGMVDEACARVAATGRFGSVRGRAADLQSLPFDDGQFDRVVANHMLYHLPDPALGVAELARVVAPEGLVVAATNGQGHLRELFEIRSEVFGVHGVNETIEVFGADVGFGILRDHFGEVAWGACDDELRCTEPADVVAYLRSTPPGEDATPDELVRLERAVDRRFEAGGGAFVITKDVGAFACRSPRR